MDNMKLLRRDANSFTFAAPSDPDQTVRFKTVQSMKNLNGVRVQNAATDIIFANMVPVEIRQVSATDTLSCRIRISGTTAANTSKSQLLKHAATQLLKWADEGVMDGFEPTTTPVVLTSTTV